MAHPDFATLRRLEDLYLINLLRDPEPNRQLYIAQYTAKAAYEFAWDTEPDLLYCRGLVVDEQGNCWGRGFQKFFGIGQREGLTLEELAKKDWPHMSEKLDGSMIVLFHDPFSKRWRMITKGSWNSPQARAAKQFWDSIPYQAEAEALLPEFNSFILEYTAPDNRIVVSYPKPGLTLIGMIDNRTGEEYPYGLLDYWAHEMHIPAVPTPLTTANWTDLVVAERDNFEGHVLHWPALKLRVKVKLKSYQELHRIFTGTNRRTIWEAWSGFEALYEEREGMFIFHGDDYGYAKVNALRAKLPDELYGWFNDAIYFFRSEAERLRHEVEEAVQDLWDLCGVYDPYNRETRKQAAEYVREHLHDPVRNWALNAWQTKDWENHHVGGLYKYLEPKGNTLDNPIAAREDV